MDVIKENLLFRRQFLLGSKHIEHLNRWNKLVINKQFYLTVHPELETVQTDANGIQLTLLGFIFDPLHPLRSNWEVLHHINCNSTCFDDVIRETDKCGGRWVIIYTDGVDSKVFHDACGLRQVFYARCDGEIWCGSQPSILVENLPGPFDVEELAVELLKSPQFEDAERVWPGDGTLIRGIKHLMPNHYLDLTEGKAVRYWPKKSLEPLAPDQAVLIACEMLRGSLQAAAHRYDIMLPITAGWESRVLLAASKEIKQQVFYYISMHSGLTEKDADIQVPSQLLPQLGLDFHVMHCEETMDPEFKEIYQKNVTLGRFLPKTFSIYQHFKSSQGKLNICGNTSEVAKKCVYTLYYIKEINGEVLSGITGYRNINYATACYDKWLQESEEIARSWKINIFDLFYWEQRLGNWGAMYPAEQDIAIDEYCPFNNRKLLTTLMSVDEKYRIPPKYHLYRELIKHMWPETLVKPINPMKLKKRIKNLIRESYVKYVLR